MALMPRLAAQSLKLKLPPAIRFRLQEDSQAARAADNSLVQPGGSSAESASGAQADANSDYLARLSRYIEAHSTKPKLGAGSPAFLESDVLLRLDGDGKLLSAEIRIGSSYPVVDDDALAQMRAIARFPPPPKAHYAVVIQWRVNKIPSLTDMRIIQTRAPNPAQPPPPARRRRKINGGCLPNNPNCGMLDPRERQPIGPANAIRNPKHPEHFRSTKNACKGAATTITAVPYTAPPAVSADDGRLNSAG
jgi:TonB family protein